jgi:hypothetical protein
MMSPLGEYAIVTIGVLTLLAASAALYGVLTINTQIQAKPDLTKIQDYSTQLDSLNSQINSMKSQLLVLSDLQNNIADVDKKITDLDNLKGNITNIQQQVANLESVNNQVQQIASVNSNLASVLDKSSYFPGDAIRITVIGGSPQNIMQIELLDSSGFVLVHQQTWADSSGKSTYALQLSSAIPPGNYVLKLTSGQQATSQPILVLSPGTGQSTTSSNGILTVQTDKSTYRTGEQIEVSGKAQPNTNVSAVMTSPTGKIYDSVTVANADGTYTLFFSPLQPYETGRWSISVSNLAQTTIVYVTIQQS